MIMLKNLSKNVFIRIIVTDLYRIYIYMALLVGTSWRYGNRKN